MWARSFAYARSFSARRSGLQDQGRCVRDAVLGRTDKPFPVQVAPAPQQCLRSRGFPVNPIGLRRRSGPTRDSHDPSALGAP